MRPVTWFLKRMFPMFLAIIGIVRESTFILCLAIFFCEYLILEGISNNESDN